MDYQNDMYGNRNNNNWKNTGNQTNKGQYRPTPLEVVGAVIGGVCLLVNMLLVVAVPLTFIGLADYTASNSKYELVDDIFSGDNDDYDYNYDYNDDYDSDYDLDDYSNIDEGYSYSPNDYSERMSEPVSDSAFNTLSYRTFEDECYNENGVLLGSISCRVPQFNMRSAAAGNLNDTILYYVNSFIDLAYSDVEMLSEDTEWLNAAIEEGYFYPFTMECTYEVTYFGNRFVSINLLEYTDTGGAHPFLYKNALVLDIEEGVVRFAEEMFDMSEEEIVAACADIYSTKEYVDETTLENIRQLEYMPDFYLTEEGVVFFFQQYEVSSYAEGFVEIEMPYDTEGLMKVEVE